jgi:two-component system, OmpR family, alkaline phosphatase synthesis response regulator PhoP
MIVQQRKILIADDETHILNVLSIKLQNAGFSVIPAEDGAAALELARSNHPDLIITDYQMPQLSGVELCARLRGDPETCGIPAIVLTARGFSIDETEVSQSNIRRVISKPFSPRQILACVNELLDLVPAESGQTAASGPGATQEGAEALQTIGV